MRESPARAGSTRTTRIDPAVRTVAFTVIVGALAVVFDTTIVSVCLLLPGRPDATSHDPPVTGLAATAPDPPPT